MEGAIIMSNSLVYGDVVGLNKQINIGGKMMREINLDCAATTPAFTDVANEVNEWLRTYGSIGRGRGTKAIMSSVFYENARETVKKFVGADHEKYTVVFVNNTTDGINKLASALITSKDDIVITTPMEHHANLLSWRMRCNVLYAELDEKGRVIIDSIEKLLQDNKGVKLVAITAASNVTGYINDVHAIAEIAHEHGAKIVVDGAQIVAHRKFSMRDFSLNEPCNLPNPDTGKRDIDYFVFSAHKMYSPFGGGALIGLTKEFNKKPIVPPMFYGGGMVDEVTKENIVWLDAPALYESGSPNFLGVVGMVKAIEILQSVGFDKIKAHEQELLQTLIGEFRKLNEKHVVGMRGKPSIVMYGDINNTADRVGLLTFNAFNYAESAEMVAMFLAKRGIGVRHAKFCAHIYVDYLIQAGFDAQDMYPPDENAAIADDSTLGCAQKGGMVRASFGIFTTKEDVLALVNAMDEGFGCGFIDENVLLYDHHMDIILPPDRG